MNRGLISLIAAGVALLGCQSAPKRAPVANSSPAQALCVAGESKPVSATPSPAAVRPVAFQESLPAPRDAAPILLDPREEFGLQAFVAEVVARHPSVQSMVAAWQAAAQRYPQAVALDDPMLMAMTAPASFGSPTTEDAYVIEMRQKFPWFGKRSLRGAAALEETEAAAQEVQDARLAITLVAQLAYIEYFLANQQIAIVERNVSLMKDFRESARVRYQTNLVTQQDVLQSEVELADLERRKLEQVRKLRVAIARMNTLLLRAPECPLPRPTLSVSLQQLPCDVALLRAWAIQNRPDLAALAHRIDLESVNVALAKKQYYPDVELFGRYDSFWQPASTQGPLQGQVGVSTNLPVYHRKLQAAVLEAQFKLKRQQAEYDRLANEITLDVQTTWEELQESRQALELYEVKLLPASEQYLAAARSNYEVGKATFLELVQAQRQVVMAQEKLIEAKAMLAQRVAELERNLGGMLPLTGK